MFDPDGYRLRGHDTTIACLAARHRNLHVMGAGLLLGGRQRRSIVVDGNLTNLVVALNVSASSMMYSSMVVNCFLSVIYLFFSIARIVGLAARLSLGGRCCLTRYNITNACFNTLKG